MVPGLMRMRRRKGRRICAADPRLETLALQTVLCEPRLPQRLAAFGIAVFPESSAHGVFLPVLRGAADPDPEKRPPILILNIITMDAGGTPVVFAGTAPGTASEGAGALLTSPLIVDYIRFALNFQPLVEEEMRYCRSGAIFHL
jgi:hypothetical protein